MIQRIQTLFLLLASAFMLLLLTLPLATYLYGDKLFGLNVMGLVMPHNFVIDGAYKTLWLGGLVLLALVLPLITVALYKNRKLQLKLCLAMMFLFAAIQGVVVYRILYLEKMFSELERSSSASYSVVALMPLIGMILVWLAMRGIRSDEKLVRSLDRIR